MCEFVSNISRPYWACALLAISDNMLMLITGWFLDAQETFPDPKKLSVELHRTGFKGIWMLDPGIKVEEGYEAYDTGSQKDVWIQTATGKQYVGMFHFENITLLIEKCAGL